MTPAIIETEVWSLIRNAKRYTNINNELKLIIFIPIKCRIIVAIKTITEATKRKYTT